MKKLFVVILLILFCFVAANAQESTTTSAPTSTLTLTPYPPTKCYVDLTNVTLEVLTVQVGTTGPSNWTNYRIGINFSDVPCDPWQDAKGWQLVSVPDGEYSTYWLNHFEEGPQYGQEVCISWSCYGYGGGFWTGEDSEMLYAYNYLPQIGR